RRVSTLLELLDRALGGSPAGRLDTPRWSGRRQSPDAVREPTVGVARAALADRRLPGFPALPAVVLRRGAAHQLPVPARQCDQRQRPPLRRLRLCGGLRGGCRRVLGWRPHGADKLRADVTA